MVYDQWHTVTIENIQYTQGDPIAGGIYVKCAGPTPGARSMTHF